MHHDLFWNLFAKNLAGEASEKEIQELTCLLKAEPGLSYAAQNVADIWKLPQPDRLIEAEQAYRLHHCRMIKKRLISPTDQIENNPKTQKKITTKWPKILRTIFLITLLILLASILAAEGKIA